MVDLLQQGVSISVFVVIHMIAGCHKFLPIV
jgi:hypothetical protein